ncbi:MAG: hypothetical protein DCF25_03160 [Leptolyngbya foveolarum]|uniref:DUF218 domain-containing protein n=1 Tax=Leptolyngbya foveolarum TaxID=47253 RepID=A0A2W4UPG0_9CYAN|nr:MAG: hypothetical protein DCF25_03160 [Leptolyngbya foveolarum]
MLVLLTRILLWASIGLLLWYILVRVIPQKYLTLFGGIIFIALLALSFLEADNATVSIIWQIISFPFRPLGFALVLLGGALGEGYKRIKPMPVMIALSVLLFSSIPILAQALVTEAEGSVRQAFTNRSELCEGVCRTGEVPGANLGEAGAIVVIGDQRNVSVAIDGLENIDDTSINTVLAPRLIYAADLYDRARALGASPFVIVTAGGSDGDPSNTIVRNILVRNGVPESAIRVEDSGLNIRETAEDVEELLEESQVVGNREARSDSNNDARIVLVAPAIIMSRAALTFERIGLEVIARPTDFYSARFNRGGDLLERLPSILPSVDALQLTTRYWDEVLTSLYYFLRGWLPNFNFGWDPSIEI